MRSFLLKVIGVVLFTSTGFATNGFGASNRLPIAGDESAIITIQVFTDFSCPYCAQGEKLMEEALSSNKGQIKYVFRNLVLPMFGPKSENAARAYSTVYLQSARLAYDFQKQLFQNQEEFNKIGEPYLYELADKLKVNMAQMKSDMSSEKVSRMLEEDKIIADGLGIQGTPTFIIGTEIVTGSSDSKYFRKSIKQEIKKQIRFNKETCNGKGC